MLDPLTALSLASSVVQIVDFGTRLLSDASHIYRTGTTLEHADFEAITTDLIEVNGLLESRSRSWPRSSSPLLKEEAALDKLIFDCSAAAKEFIQCLETLKRGTGRWDSFLQAILTVWNKEKITAMVARLESFRSELVLRILILLNAKANQHAADHDERFDRLDQTHAEIVEVMSINQETLATGFESNTKNLREALHENDVTAARRHEETIAAILTLRDGQTKIISKNNGICGSEAEFGEVGRRTYVRLQAGSRFLGEDGQPHVEEFLPIQTRVLDCLHFRQITDRVETVSEAHQNTCQWIYQTPEANQTPWSNFIEWLEHGSGCYWINGKAGSGKSTLMKYVNADSRTTRALSKWAGDNTLVHAAFFFWNLGSGLQKSQHGLIRSLLYDVLNKHQHLIPTVLPELCRAAAKAKPNETLSEPTLAELMKGFKNLVHQRSTRLRICFLIDGIDEYEGDHAEISELLTTVSNSTWIKLIVSSRPIPACVEAFSRCASLRLQDLTHNDIQLYVEDKLKARLEARENLEASEIVSELVEKASGVFIWVVLAVRSLLTGLQNRDRMGDLRRRLDELPDDLAELYSHILRRMPPRYREQASQLFQLALTSTEVQAESPLTALQLSFAEEEDMQCAIKAPIKEITTKEEARRLEEVEARIRSRCCGLVEIQDQTPRRRLISSKARPRIGFLHKTVVEYLRDPKIWSDMVSLTAETSFDPILALVGSCVSLTKSLPASKIINVDQSLRWHSMRHCLEYCTIAQSRHCPSTTEYLDELDKTLTHHWKSAWQATGDKGSCRTKNNHWVAGESLSSRTSESFDEYDCFLCLAIRTGLASYVGEKPLQDEFSRDKRDHHLNLSLHCLFRTHGFAPENSKIMIHAQIAESLLQEGADPNDCCSEDAAEHTRRGRTPWEMILDHAIKLKEDRNFLQDFDRHGYAEVFTKLVVCFVLSGADLNARAIAGTKKYRGLEPWTHHQSALVIIDRLLLQPTFKQLDEKQAMFPRLKVDRRSEENIAIVQQYHDRLTSLMIDRGAKAREWNNDRIISGPPEDSPAEKLTCSQPLLGQPTLEESLCTTEPSCSTESLSLRLRTPSPGSSRSRTKLRRLFKGLRSESVPKEGNGKIGETHIANATVQMSHAPIHKRGVSKMAEIQDKSLHWAVI